ncbi:hypothetical protein B0A48_14276 [Cryoendolithus antarcticus]|uniref:Uncharacterized protein n=1 Tax=Cryoendolithus antarcticus TaxID=1507870 RepID=A0A1V8SLR5_9PEZI|nr:hypothetical protein B0A48_14276 [Cryoendolithus antarcticus]
MPSLREYRRQAYNAAAEAPHNTIMALFLFCMLIAVSTIAGLKRPYIPALKPPTHPVPAIQIRLETTSAGSVNMDVLNGVASTGTTSSSMVMIDINTFDPVLPTGTDLARLTTAIGNNYFDVTSIEMITTGGTTTIPTIVAPTGVTAPFPTVTAPTGVPAPFPSIVAPTGMPAPFLNISTFRSPSTTIVATGSQESINCANPANAYEVFYCALQHTSTTSTSIVGRAPTTMLTLPSASTRSNAGRDPQLLEPPAFTQTAVSTSVAPSCTQDPNNSLAMLECMIRLADTYTHCDRFNRSSQWGDHIDGTATKYHVRSAIGHCLDSRANALHADTDIMKQMECMKSSLSVLLALATQLPVATSSVHG